MAAKAARKELSIADKLDALFELQKIDSQIDKIRTVRGELPLEVQDLEDEVAGLQTRISNLEEEVAQLDTEVSDRKNATKDSETAIAKYKEQQNNVRNNREYESLSKEIEFQELEIKLHEKKSKEAKFKIESKQEVLDEAKTQLELRSSDLATKKSELDAIISETQVDEDKLLKSSENAKKNIEERLLFAYDRLRTNAKNGLAVVPVDRDACGGCFNKIPAQRQLDIETKKKIIVCEHCGRILVPKIVA
ncbi:MAG: zinc ribbon domain-containing protein [Bacteroidota bacterium]